MIITLTTDFGLSDPFVAVMKGVILSIAPEARIVDIAHEIASHDILEGAFILESAFRYFPPKTIHVAVVDPGVGGARRPIAASVSNHFFVGPDNGVLSFVLDSAPGAPIPSAYHVTNTSLFRHPVSNTFHGRDIFAPVAAHLARGVPLDAAGPRIVDFIRQAPSGPRANGRGRLVATVLRIDRFGNIITNLRRDDLPEYFAIRIAGFEIRRLLSHYDEAQPGEFFAIEGSTGRIELSLRRGSAARTLGLNRGVEIEVETEGSNQ